MVIYGLLNIIDYGLFVLECDECWVIGEWSFAGIISADLVNYSPVQLVYSSGI
jgi:hypothetical protein